MSSVRMSTSKGSVIARVSNGMKPMIVRSGSSGDADSSTVTSRSPSSGRLMRRSIVSPGSLSASRALRSSTESIVTPSA
jgi:hypothetical protein